MSINDFKDKKILLEATAVVITITFIITPLLPKPPHHRHIQSFNMTIRC
jgi:hypothetical protein